MNTSQHLISVITLLLVLTFSYANAEPRSGYEFIKPETRDMQDDDFANPGLQAVDDGKGLFNEEHTSGKSCASCHGSEGEKLDTKKIASYPVVDSNSGEIISLQKKISQCRGRVSDKALAVNHAELLSLETFVRNRAKGEMVNVKTDGKLTELLKQGEELYKTRYGLIDMSCYQCHVMYPGQMIRGQKISQGQGNGFPAYRLDIGEMTNLNQRITQCLNLMRAQPFASDSQEIKLLELYLMSRSNGLKIETPAVRY